MTTLHEVRGAALSVRNAQEAIDFIDWCRYSMDFGDAQPAAPAEGLREAASAIAQPPGAAEMARWMEAWDREPPTLRVPPVVTVKFSRDATPEEVDTVREQIESLIAIDERRLARALQTRFPERWNAATVASIAADLARAYREDSA